MKQIIEKSIIREIDLSQYEILKMIGRGGFGLVYKVVNKYTNQLCAAKMLTKVDINSEKTIREVMIPEKIEHPCILRLYGFSLHDFVGDPYPVILTPFMPNGSLDKILELQRRGKAPNAFDTTKKYIIMYGIAKGMRYLHKHNIIHRDLKSSNILLNEDYYPVIGDFGLAKFMDSEDHNKQSTVSGTPTYQAPEIFRLDDKICYNEKVDVYAYAMILYELVTGMIPFESTNKIALINRIQADANFRPDFPESGVDDEIKTLIQKCWDYNPEKRPTFKMIIDKLNCEDMARRMNVVWERFRDYTKYISRSGKRFDSNRSKIFGPTNDELIHTQMEKSFVLYPRFELTKLSEECQELVKKAENGDSETMFIISLNLIYGKNDFPLKPELGMLFLNKAINENHLKSKVLKSEILHEGLLVPKNNDEAKRLLITHKGYNSDLNARLTLVKIELDQQDPDYSYVSKELEFLSKRGKSAAALILGKLYMRNIEGKLKRNFKLSSKSFNIAQRMKDPEALAYLSLFYYYGYKIVDFDFKKAAELSYQSYSEGNMTGAAFYSECLARGRGVEKNEELAVSIARESSESKNSKGMNKYGLFLNQGIGNLSPNKKEAARLWKMSSESGDAEGKFLYGSCLLEGGEYEVEKNPKKAIKYLEESIEGGCITAMAVLGQLKVCGHFVEQDNYNGIEMIEEAADLGDDYAIIIYSHFLARGIGTSVNYEKARNYLKIGMERNNSDCFRLYGELIAQGTVPFVDPAKGIELIEKADKMELDESELEKKQQKQKLLDEYEKNRLEEEKDDEIGTEYYSGCNVC